MKQIAISNAPSLEQAKRYATSRYGQTEGIWQPMYDNLTYPAAGAQQLTFFQQAIGTNGATREDTNLQIPGQLSSPKQFLVTGIAVYFLPQSSNPASGPVADASASSFINDVYAFGRAGVLQFRISDKEYLTDGPLGKFPPRFRMGATSALSDTTTAGANQVNKIDYAAWAGAVYQVTPLLIPASQSFSVTMTWPGGVVALPSGNDARVGVELLGFEYRLSQ